MRSGARNQLLSELKRMGPGCWAAADSLGIAVLLAPSIPCGAAFAADLENGILVCLASAPEWSTWAGIAYFLAHDLGLKPTYAMVFAAADFLATRSGILFRCESA